MGVNKGKVYKITEAELGDLVLKAATAGIKAYKTENLTGERKKVNKLLYRTKVLLEKYRYLTEYCNNAVYTLEEAEKEDDTVDDVKMLMKVGLLQEEQTLHNLQKGVITVKMYMAHVNRMLSVYEHDCMTSSSKIKQRQWRVIYHMYLSEDRKSTKEIAEMEVEEVRTIQNDAKAAREDLTALIFGIDGLLLRIIKE